MDYGRIVSRSFEIAWQHKWLWIFGMFSAGTGFNLKLEYIMGTSPTNPFDTAGLSNLDPSALLTAYFGLIPLVIILGLMIIFSKGAIIDSVNRIERGGSYSFSSAFSAGVDYFLRFFGLGIIYVVVWCTYMLFAVLSVTLLFNVHTALGVLSIFIAIFVTLFILFVLVQVSNLADRVIVIRNSGIFDAISEGFLLLKMHFGKNIIAFLIMIAFGIAFSIGILIIMLMVNFPIDALIQSLHLKSYLAMVAALIFGLPATFLLGGIFGLFSTTYYTLFYLELVEPKTEPVSAPQPDQKNNEPPVL